MLGVRIRVQLFAVARQRVGAPTVEVALSAPATVADLKRRLADEHPAIALLLPSLRFAVNGEYATDSDPIPPGAEVAAIPPVSGGRAMESPPSERPRDGDRQ
jgi:molybdopterin converting factor subunit 1